MSGSRIDYFDAHFKEMYNAIVEDGVDLMGYTSWGCIDIVSESTNRCLNVMVSSM